jgi:hypothetical protein
MSRSRMFQFQKLVGLIVQEARRKVHLDSIQTGPNDVLIKLNATGICHSDLHFMLNDWATPKMSSLGTKCAGHEGAGVIVKCGDQVKTLKPGMRAGYKVSIRIRLTGKADIVEADSRHVRNMRIVPKRPRMLLRKRCPHRVNDRRLIQAIRGLTRTIHHSHPRQRQRLHSWSNHVLSIDNLHINC